MDTKVTKRLYIPSYLATKQFRKYLKFRYFKTKCPGKYSEVWKLEGSLSQLKLGTYADRLATNSVCWSLAVLCRR